MKSIIIAFTAALIIGSAFLEHDGANLVANAANCQALDLNDITQQETYNLRCK